MVVSGSVFYTESDSRVRFFLWWSMIVITRKKALEKQHILTKIFLDIISTADQRRKKELYHRSQSKKLIQKQPFKLAFLMRPKSGTAMASRQK